MAAAPQPYADSFFTSASGCALNRYTLAENPSAALPSLTRIATRIPYTLAENLGPLLRSLTPETGIHLGKTHPSPFPALRGSLRGSLIRLRKAYRWHSSFLRRFLPLFRGGRARFFLILEPDSWLLKFQQMTLRCPVLIALGPSCIGKTEWVLSLFKRPLACSPATWSSFLI